MFALPIIY